MEPLVAAAVMLGRLWHIMGEPRGHNSQVVGAPPRHRDRPNFKRDQAIAMLAMEQGVDQATLAKRFGVSRGRIYQIVTKAEVTEATRKRERRHAEDTFGRFDPAPRAIVCQECGHEEVLPEKGGRGQLDFDLAAEWGWSIPEPLCIRCAWHRDEAAIQAVCVHRYEYTGSHAPTMPTTWQQRCRCGLSRWVVDPRRTAVHLAVYGRWSLV